MRTRMIAAALVLLLVSACREARIDGSDPERARVTIVEARKSLPAERQNEFDRNLQLLMRHGGDPPILADPHVRKQIDGKTAQEVITAGEALRREEEARLHDEKVRKDLDEIHNSLSRIDAHSPRVKITKEVVPVAVGPQLPTSTIGAADAEIHTFCTRNSPNAAEVLECEKSEMAFKQVVNGPLPDGVAVEVGGRIRDRCRSQYPESYGARAGCESGLVTEINMIAANPALLNQLPPERQQELRRLSGQ